MDPRSLSGKGSATWPRWVGTVLVGAVGLVAMAVDGHAQTRHEAAASRQVAPSAGASRSGWHAKGRRPGAELVSGPVLAPAKAASWQVAAEEGELPEVIEPQPAEPVLQPGAAEPADELHPDHVYDGPVLLESDLSGACDQCGEAGPMDEPWGMWPDYSGAYVAGGPCYPLLGTMLRNLWVRTEYLLWWTEGFQVGPLATGQLAENANRTELLNPEGANTTVLLGHTWLAGGARSGGRIRFGTWLDPCRQVGIEASYMGLGHDVSRFGAPYGEISVVGRPLFDVAGVAGQSLAGLVAFPDLVSGSMLVTGTTTFQGVEVLYRRLLVEGSSHRIDFLAGWRFNRLDDELSISESKMDLESESTIRVVDQFVTENQFHGAELGIEAQMRRGCWTLELLGKLALGNSHWRATVDGSTVTTIPGQSTTTTAAGLLAQPSNMGTFEENEFAVVPELGVMIGYDLTRRLRATFGWSFIYWSRVARPGDLVDLDVNLTQVDSGVEGLSRPEFRWVGTDLWIQGLNFGLDWRF